MPGRQAGKSTFCRRNHPWGSFFLQRDVFRGRKSSLGELFLAEGCLGGRDFSDMLFSGLLAAAELSGEIIPGRAFLCRGMHFAEGKHPWESFSLQRDAFRRRKSSLEELFSAEGCISQKEIIPAGAFHCRGMHFAEGNHLWKSFFLQRDAFRRRKSSLGELFSVEGCISQKEIISGRAFFCRGMLCPTE